MNRNVLRIGFLCLASALFLAGCGNKVSASGKATTLAPAAVEHEENTGLVTVDRPDQFPFVTAGEHMETPELNVTGTVSPDVSRNIPVISLASGRVIEMRARIGDSVAKGQLLMRVQSADVSQAFSDYRQAVADETLSHAQLERSKLLFEK